LRLEAGTFPKGGWIRDIEDDGRRQEIYDKLLEGPLRKNLGSDPANKIKTLSLPNILLYKQAYEIIHKWVFVGFVVVVVVVVVNVV
jgi:hypothetical protein